ncbi:MAG: hypothetical protein ACP5NZ_01845 [Nanobdellota archaeon]
MSKFSKLFLLSTLLIVFLSATVIAVEPFGANVVNLTSQRAPADNATSAEAIAGNVTELSVTGYSITQSWQGYFGNVSGTIQLADNSDNVMYNWSLASPEGEIYASTNDSLTWATIKCLADEKGANFENLEAEFGIASDDVDGVNETFSLTGTHENGFGLVHDLFYTNNIEFSAGECNSTHIFAASQNATDSTFQEVLLYEPTTSSVVFTSILDEESPLGFDGNAHDFEMLVLENGHLIDTSTTTYYFWVELE